MFIPIATWKSTEAIIYPVQVIAKALKSHPQIMVKVSSKTKIQSYLTIGLLPYTQTLFPLDVAYWSIWSFSESLQYLFLRRGPWPIPHTY